MYQGLVGHPELLLLKKDISPESPVVNKDIVSGEIIVVLGIIIIVIQYIPFLPVVGHFFDPR